MENAAEALKMFFAVFVFALALSVFFRMTSIAKDTSDMIFTAIDKTTYINYNADTSNEANRKVKFQDMIPTIYRYAQEGYGVTIIDGNDIVARFDLDTESQVSSCFWSEYRETSASVNEKEKSKAIKEEICEYLNKNIIDKVNNLNPHITTMTYFDINSLDTLIKNIYKTGETDPRKDPVYTSWLSANTYQNNNVTQRINCDMYGGSTNCSWRNPGINEDDINTEYIAGKHKAVCEGRGLLEDYKDAIFTETIVQIDRNEYIKDENGNKTDLLVFGTIRYTKKREIIYVKNN